MRSRSAGSTQEPADGPLAMVQSVFDHGRLVGFRQPPGAGGVRHGGASRKRSVSSPAARGLIERLGHDLAWRGALSADVILTGAEADLHRHQPPPRRAEQHVVRRRGPRRCDGRAVRGTSTRRRCLGATALRRTSSCSRCSAPPRTARGAAASRASSPEAITHTGSYCGSREELTPLPGDLMAAVPGALAGLVTLARPSAWTWFSSGSVANYALSPQGWRTIVERQASMPVSRVAPRHHRWTTASVRGRTRRVSSAHGSIRQRRSGPRPGILASTAAPRGDRSGRPLRRRGASTRRCCSGS